MAEYYGVTESAIYHIKNHSASYITTKTLDLNRKRNSDHRISLLEEDLIKLIGAMRNRKLVLTAEWMKQEALELGKKHSLTKFKASNSWLARFKKRSGVGHRQLHGEAGSAQLDKYKREITDLKSLTDQYDLDKIYNLDESGLFFRSLPSCSFFVAI